MKNAIKLAFIIAVFCISVNSYAIPPEFMSCDKESLSFSDLKYYDKKELVEGYCSCMSSYESKSFLHRISLIQQKSVIRQYDPNSYQYREAEAEVKGYSDKRDTANNNASRILRILKMDYKYTETPKCEDTSESLPRD